MVVNAAGEPARGRPCAIEECDKQMALWHRLLVVGCSWMSQRTCRYCLELDFNTLPNAQFPVTWYAARVSRLALGCFGGTIAKLAFFFSQVCGRVHDLLASCTSVLKAGIGYLSKRGFLSCHAMPQGYLPELQHWLLSARSPAIVQEGEHWITDSDRFADFTVQPYATFQREKINRQTTTSDKTKQHHATAYRNLPSICAIYFVILCLSAISGAFC